MPYFPRIQDTRPYHCPGCGGWFLPSDLSCCVAHAPGTCCHLYETPVAAPRPGTLPAAPTAEDSH